MKEAGWEKGFIVLTIGALLIPTGYSCLKRW